LKGEKKGGVGKSKVKQMVNGKNIASVRLPGGSRLDQGGGGLGGGGGGRGGGGKNT